MDPFEAVDGQWVRGQWDGDGDGLVSGLGEVVSGPDAEVFRGWADGSGDLSSGVRARAVAVVAARNAAVHEVSGAGARDVEGGGRAEALRRDLDRQAVVEQVVLYAQQRFDVAYTAWATGTRSPGTAHTTEAEGTDGPAHVATVPGAAVRVHRAVWQAVESSVRASADRLPVSALDAPTEQVLARADRFFGASEPAVHLLLDRAAVEDARQVDAVRTFEQTVPKAAPGTQPLGSDGRLSATGREQLRQDWVRQTTADHRTVFGDLTATGRTTGVDTVAAAGAPHPTAETVPTVSTGATADGSRAAATDTAGTVDAGRTGADAVGTTGAPAPVAPSAVITATTPIGTDGPTATEGSPVPGGHGADTPPLMATGGSAVGTATGHLDSSAPTGGGPGTPRNSDAIGPRAPERRWQDLLATRTESLPHQVHVSLAREAAARQAVDGVREAAAGSWRSALPDLGTRFRDTFDLDRRGVTVEAQQAAALSVARTANSHIDGLVSRGPYPPGDAVPQPRDVAAAVITPHAVGRHTALAVARAGALDDAAREARSFAQQQPHSSPESVRQAVETHTQRVSALFDRVFPTQRPDTETGVVLPSRPAADHDLASRQTGNMTESLDRATGTWIGERAALSAQLSGGDNGSAGVVRTETGGVGAGGYPGASREVVGSVTHEVNRALRGLGAPHRLSDGEVRGRLEGLPSHIARLQQRAVGEWIAGTVVNDGRPLGLPGGAPRPREDTGAEPYPTRGESTGAGRSAPALATRVATTSTDATGGRGAADSAQDRHGEQSALTTPSPRPISDAPSPFPRPPGTHYFGGEHDPSPVPQDTDSPAAIQLGEPRPPGPRTASLMGILNPNPHTHAPETPVPERRTGPETLAAEAPAAGRPVPETATGEPEDGGRGGGTAGMRTDGAPVGMAPARNADHPPVKTAEPGRSSESGPNAKPDLSAHVETATASHPVTKPEPSGGRDPDPAAPLKTSRGKDRAVEEAESGKPLSEEPDKGSAAGTSGRVEPSHDGGLTAEEPAKEPPSDEEAAEAARSRPWARPIGVPRAGLPHIPAVVEALRTWAGELGLTVPEGDWDRLPQRLLSNYSFLVAERGDRPEGLLVPLGPAEALIGLDPSDPTLAHGSDPADGGRLPTIKEKPEEEDIPLAESSAAGASRGLKGGKDIGDDTVTEEDDGALVKADPFHATASVNSSFATGGHTQARSSGTSATRTGAAMTYGIGVPGVAHLVSVGASVSGTANASSRSQTHLADSERGHVEDNRDPRGPLLLSYKANWHVRMRPVGRDPKWPAARPVDESAEQSLLLYVARPYLDPAADHLVVATGPEVRRDGLPSHYFASGMTGLPRLLDEIDRVLGDNGLHLSDDPRTRSELVHRLWNLQTFLDNAVNHPHGYTFRLHDRYGRVVATVNVHSARRNQGFEQPVGADSDTAHLENVRTAIDGISGGHTLSQSSTLTPVIAEIDLLPNPTGHPDMGLGFNASLSASWNTSESIGATRTGLWVMVPRFSGVTSAYVSEFTHHANITLRHGGEDEIRTTHDVDGAALVRMPRQEAFRHGYPVDRDALNDPPHTSAEEAVGETKTVGATRTGDATKGPDKGAVEEHDPGRGSSAARGEEAPTGSHTAMPPALHTADTANVGHDGAGVKRDEPPAPEAVAYSPDALKDAPTAEQRAPRPLPGHLAHPTDYSGIGMGLVEVHEGTAQRLYDGIAAQLNEHGFLLPDKDNPISVTWWEHGASMDSRIDNEDQLRKFLEDGLASHHDRIHQDGLPLVLHRSRGFGGVTFDVDAARITISAKRAVPTEYMHTASDHHLVNLAMGMDSASMGVGGSRNLSASVRAKAVAQQLLGGAEGFGVNYGRGASDSVFYMNNRPELLEYGSGDFLQVKVTSDYTAKIQFQHSGLSGRVLRGRRDPVPLVFPNEPVIARVLPLGDGSQGFAAGRGPTPPRVLDHAVIFHLDGTGFRSTLSQLMGQGMDGPQGPAARTLDSMAASLRAHLKESAFGALITDQVFDHGLWRDTHLAVNVEANLGSSDFMGATDNPFVQGIIKLWLAQSTTTTTNSRGLSWTQADVTAGGPSASGAVNVSGGADASRHWQFNRSESLGVAGAKELIALSFSRVYLYRTRADFAINVLREKHGKFAIRSRLATSGQIANREVHYLLPEPEALLHYADGVLPVSDQQLTSVMRRWSKTGAEPEPELKLHPNTMAGVLARWRQTPGGAAPALEAARELQNRHDDGEDVVWDPAVRDHFHEVFGDEDLHLDERRNPLASLRLPEYLTRQDPGGAILGHSNVLSIDHENGRSTADLFREAVERAAPGLLTHKPELWTESGRHIGRLQGSLDTIVGLFGRGREDAAYEDMLSANGLEFYLTNQVGWFLSDGVRVTIRAELHDDATVVGERPDAGLENYSHHYTNTSKGTSRDDGQTFTPAKASASHGHGGGGGSAPLSSGSHRGTSHSEAGVQEQTVYSWDGLYGVNVSHRFVVEAVRLDMPHRPLNELGVNIFRKLANLGALQQVTVNGVTRLQLPRGLVEARPHTEPVPADPLRDLRLLPRLPGDAYVVGVTADRVLPATRRMLVQAFGPSADPSRYRDSPSLSVLFSRTHLSNLIGRMGPEDRVQISHHLFQPGSSPLGLKLYVRSSAYDMRVLNDLPGTGTGRYNKHQSGTTASASYDRWQPNLAASGSGSGPFAHHPADSASASSSANRSTSESLADAGTNNYRREQHAKQQGDTQLVRMRVRLRVEAEGYRMHTFREPEHVSDYVSEPINGEMYAELSRDEVAQVRARLTAALPDGSRELAAWRQARASQPTDLAPLLAQAAGLRGADASRADLAVGNTLQDRTPAGAHGLSLTVNTDQLALEAHRLTLTWAEQTLEAGHAAVRTTDAAAPPPEALNRFQRYRTNLPRVAANGSFALRRQAIHDIVATVGAYHMERPDNPLREPVAPPPSVSFVDIHPLALARDMAHHLDAYVRYVPHAAAGGEEAVQERWIAPDGTVGELPFAPAPVSAPAPAPAAVRTPAVVPALAPAAEVKPLVKNVTSPIGVSGAASSTASIPEALTVGKPASGFTKPASALPGESGSSEAAPASPVKPGTSAPARSERGEGAAGEGGTEERELSAPPLKGLQEATGSTAGQELSVPPAKSSEEGAVPTGDRPTRSPAPAVPYGVPGAPEEASTPETVPTVTSASREDAASASGSEASATVTGPLDRAVVSRSTPSDQSLAVGTVGVPAPAAGATPALRYGELAAVEPSRPPQTPGYLRATGDGSSRYQQLNADQSVEFLRRADMMAPGEPEPVDPWTLETLPGLGSMQTPQGRVPLMTHAVVLGGPSGAVPTGPRLDRLADLARSTGNPVVVWTDVPRAAVDVALFREDPVAAGVPAPVRDLVEWAGENNVLLVNADEIFHAGQPMPDAPSIWELRAQGGAGPLGDAEARMAEAITDAFGGPRAPVGSAPPGGQRDGEPLGASTVGDVAPAQSAQASESTVAARVGAARG
ncbi:hypothetical protein [Actinacidiphila reveromycinica]|uniref:hypothetical protein n=1 Tax=Actinacidiphila reveromycinica TaxID=659352 RepID=UPI001922FB6D|nr:hypothetical protein [Streptomyces sp. SN-593]